MRSFHCVLTNCFGCAECAGVGEEKPGDIVYHLSVDDTFVQCENALFVRADLSVCDDVINETSFGPISSRKLTDPLSGFVASRNWHRFGFILIRVDIFLFFSLLSPSVFARALWGRKYEKLWYFLCAALDITCRKFQSDLSCFPFICDNNTPKKKNFFWMSRISRGTVKPPKRI